MEEYRSTGFLNIEKTEKGYSIQETVGEPIMDSLDGTIFESQTVKEYRTLKGAKSGLRALQKRGE